MYKAHRTFDPAVDDTNWQRLFNRHFQDMQSLNAICTLWINGFSKLGMDNAKRPHADKLTEVAKKYTGFEFIQTGSNIILEQIDWYKMIADKKMPLTSFVRTPEELHYCDEPDLWHDVMGHIPYLVEPSYVEMYCALAETYIRAYEAQSMECLKELDFLGGLIIELGLIREESGIKAFGSTFYSSGEMFEAFKPENQLEFKPVTMSSASGYDRSKFQGKYYIFDSIEQLNQVIDDIKKRI